MLGLQLKKCNVILNKNDFDNFHATEKCTD